MSSKYIPRPAANGIIGDNIERAAYCANVYLARQNANLERKDGIQIPADINWIEHYQKTLAEQLAIEKKWDKNA